MVRGGCRRRKDSDHSDAREDERGRAFEGMAFPAPGKLRQRSRRGAKSRLAGRRGEPWACGRSHVGVCARRDSRAVRRSSLFHRAFPDTPRGVLPTATRRSLRHSHIDMRNAPFAQRSLLLSVTGRHALRAVLVLARDVTRPMRSHEIADAIGAPRNYTAKTLNSLAKAGLLSSLRGPAGGFVLATDPNALTVADIVAVFDGRSPIDRCLLRDQRCDPSNPCVAHERWAEVPRAARRALSTTTVADLVEPKTGAGCARRLTSLSTKLSLHITMSTIVSFDPTISINELLRQYPAAVTPLAARGIDTCCRGNDSLQTAAASVGVDPSALHMEIVECPSGARPSRRPVPAPLVPGAEGGIVDWFARDFIRASLVWLVAAVSLAVAMAVYPPWTIYRTAHMHMALLGFVTMMIYGVAYHVIPRFTGQPLWSPRLPGIHVWGVERWPRAHVGRLRPSRDGHDTPERSLRRARGGRHALRRGCVPVRVQPVAHDRRGGRVAGSEGRLDHRTFAARAVDAAAIEAVRRARPRTPLHQDGNPVSRRGTLTRRVSDRRPRAVRPLSEPIPRQRARPCHLRGLRDADDHGASRSGSFRDRTRRIGATAQRSRERPIGSSPSRPGRAAPERSRARRSTRDGCASGSARWPWPDCRNPALLPYYVDARSRMGSRDARHGTSASELADASGRLERRRRTRDKSRALRPSAFSQRSPRPYDPGAP